MPRRSSVHSLPTDLRDELNARLVGSGFGNYEGLAEWLEGQGHAISKSSLHRYGQDLQADFESAMSDVRRTTELARAYVTTDADEQGALIDATARVAQEHLLRLSIALRQAEEDPGNTAKHLGRVVRALEGIGRLSLAQKKHADEVRRRAIEEAAEAGAKIARQGGLSKETVEAIKAGILGIPSGS